MHHLGGQDGQPLFGQHQRGGRGEVRIGCGQRRDRRSGKADVLGEEDAVHTRHLLGGGGVDAGDHGVRLGGSDEDDVLCACGVVGEEPAVPAEHAVVLPTPHRATDVARLRRFGGQWIRFSHCHNAIEMPNEMVISNMMVATIDG